MLIRIPCYPEITCIQSGVEGPVDYIPPMYRKETYQDCYRPIIYPTNGENLWEDTPYPNILPPPSRRAPKRHKRIRNKDVDEKRKYTKIVSRKRLPNKCAKTTCIIPNTTIPTYTIPTFIIQNTTNSKTSN